MSPLIAFDSPEAGSSSSDNLLTPPTGGANGGSPMSQQKLAEATSELKRLRETIGQKDAQLADLRGKGIRADGPDRQRLPTLHGRLLCTGRVGCTRGA